jgi:methionyl-tRNA synthetase
LRAAHAAISSSFEEIRLKEAFDRVLAEVREGNRRFHEAAPWRLSGDELAATLYEAIWTIRAVAVWSSPVLPFSAAEVARMLGEEELLAPGAWDRAADPPEPGRALGEIRPLFPRREPSRSKAATGPAPTPAAAPTLPPLAIQAARIQAVAPHPNADKLYLLTLEAGAAPGRTVVAGIRPYYTAEELIGRRLLVLTNLAPRTIRGVTSQGMILAGDDHGKPTLLEPLASTPLGEFSDGVGSDAPPIEYAQFEAAPLLVGVVVDVGAPGQLRVDVGGRTVTAEGRGSPGDRIVVQVAGRNGDTAHLLSVQGGEPIRPAAGLEPGTRIR